MISAIRFKNFKALRDTRLELGRYNLVVGPNGSGKSTLLAGLQLIARQRQFHLDEIRTVGMDQASANTEIGVQWRDAVNPHPVQLGWMVIPSGVVVSPRYPDAEIEDVFSEIRRALVFALSDEAIAAPVQLQPHMRLSSNGGGLAGVLDRMRDESPEVFEQLNEEIARLLPEFDRILFETPSPGARGLMLRTREGKHAIRAVNLSQGVLLALALLTLAYLPDPPSIIGLEEPDRGIHPRLYRDIQDALYRLSYPESFGINRAPVQVIVTTHSPFMLDLHKDHPEEIIIAEKTERGSEFHRLSERPDLAELLEEVSLGEAWYSGILGGVPAAP
jgi:predicted ATPase